MPSAISNLDTNDLIMKINITKHELSKLEIIIENYFNKVRFYYNYRIMFPNKLGYNRKHLSYYLDKKFELTNLLDDLFEKYNLKCENIVSLS